MTKILSIIAILFSLIGIAAVRNQPAQKTAPLQVNDSVPASTLDPVLGDTINALPQWTTTGTNAITTRSDKDVNLTHRTTTTGPLWIADVTNCNGASTLDTDANGRVICGADASGGGSGGSSGIGTSTITYVAVYNDTTTVTGYSAFSYTDTTKALDLNGGLDALSVTSISVSSSIYYTPLDDCSGTSAIGTDANGKLICATGYEVTLTAGDALTRTANDIDFDGGATPAGDLGNTWADPTVDDDSHAHTGTTLSGIDISGDTNLTSGDGLTLNDDDVDCDTASASVFGCLTAADFINFNISTTSTLNNTSTLVWVDKAQTLTNKTISTANNTITNAVSDGATKGIAAFTAADFADSSGVISIDYANGQAGTGLVDGFIQAADYINFNISTTSTLNNTSTLVWLDKAQTLTNKTMDYNSNTFTNFPASTGGSNWLFNAAGFLTPSTTIGVINFKTVTSITFSATSSILIATSSSPFAFAINGESTGAFWVDTKATGNVFEIQNATSNILFAVSTSTGDMTFHGHITASAVPWGVAPVVSSCGTGTPTVVGNDSAGAVTVGGGVQASCVLTFQKPWVIAPSCFANDATALQAVKASATVSALTLSVATTFAGEVVNYFCVGY